MPEVNHSATAMASNPANRKMAVLYLFMVPFKWMNGLLNAKKTWPMLSLRSHLDHLPLEAGQRELVGVWAQSTIMNILFIALTRII